MEIHKSRDHQIIEQELNENQVLASMWDVLIENPYEGMIVVNAQGYIIFINNTYLNILGLKKSDAIGKHVWDVTSHSQLPQVIETGRPILYDFWEVNGRKLIVVRIPIINNEGNVIGAIGKSLFTDIPSGKLLFTKLQVLEKELAFYKEEIRKVYKAKYSCKNLIGESESVKEIKKLARKVASSNSTILITGESGTGKELLAQAIHNAGCRNQRPFVRVNCAAVPENLLETELFGYDDGAFTGAKKGGKPGKFELAQGGTIFLDEIGEIPLTMQSKLLAVLQERELERVGGIKTVPLDVRVISATNRNLEDMVKNGTFREDLYYRLNVINFRLPSLRERSEDIPLLVNYLTHKLNKKLNCHVEGYTEQAMQLLTKYHWPGNVRQLENALERMFSFTDDKILSTEHMPFLKKIVNVNSSEVNTKSLAETIAETEKKMILDALQKVDGNRNKAAKLLDIHLSVLYRKIKKYDI
ncbi:sigma54 specific transcriptional regulator, Fis family [Desulforamulus reducens MI-1]|uniref:Sigma54 specific transcriptional regulator, Fis family n=1 Tax=Desulforamulus reducens (strain ATCC BAA-1160 / DSM 100696 / MI-1) TaxID=349161 RepID=A4J4M1_DESRM|nr:sigma-54-dependent Fis family transcriptional regulator [Desulforamulus reducens]ABO50024.1 sigma54 specific transcriptional regulator, Fis family [Desulforamulus reducens MI-1]